MHPGHGGEAMNRETAMGLFKAGEKVEVLTTAGWQTIGDVTPCCEIFDQFRLKLREPEPPLVIDVTTLADGPFIQMFICSK